MPAAQQEAPVVTSQQGNNKFTKIALIALAVVFLIIISEVAYLIFSKSDNSILDFNKTSNEERDGRTIITTSPQPTIAPPLTTNDQGVAINTDEAYSFLNSLDVASGGLVSSDQAKMYFEMAGEVVSVSFVDSERGGINTVFSIGIKRETGVINYSLTEEEVLIAEVSINASGEKRTGSITDIQEGDQILLKTTLDLLDENPYSSVILELTR